MAVDYSQSEQDRELLIRQRQRNTARAFEEMRKKIDEQIATMNMSTVSERAKRQQLEEIRDQLQKSLEAYYSDLEDGLKSDMISIGESVLSDSAAFYNSLNMPLSIGITSFPVEIMENVINGSVYGEKWFLSGVLWGDYQRKLDDINTVIAEGIGLNKPIYEIAKDLEKYVDPNARKDWAWSKVYPGTAKTVDYNAQRLARTLISHAYQQNIVRQAQANPFATGVKWEASGGERMCEICEERDGKIFPVDDVPLDHPNGMCTFAVETPSMMEMSDVLADWVNGESTDWDDQLNAYYAGVPIDHKSTANASGKEEIAHRIAEGKDITSEWQRRPDQFDFEIEDVMNAQGFDGLPRVVSSEEFDRLAKEANGGNGFIAQRTYSASDQQTLDEYRQMLYNGKWYVDCSTGGAQYGQGMYCAADYNGQLTDGIKAEMLHYKDLGESRFQTYFDIGEASKRRYEMALQQGNAIIASGGTNDQARAAYDLIMNMPERTWAEKYAPELLPTKGVSYTETLTLDSGARIISYNDLIFEFNKYVSDRKQYWSKEIDKTDEFDFDKMQKVKADRDAELKYLRNMNVGSFAVLKGYDAINAEGHGESASYTVILNRTKLIIKEP